MMMPFGKHEGEEVDELPRSYLEWLSEQDFLEEDLREEVEAALEDWRHP